MGAVAVAVYICEVQTFAKSTNKKVSTATAALTYLLYKYKNYTYIQLIKYDEA